MSLVPALQSAHGVLLVGSEEILHSETADVLALRGLVTEDVRRYVAWPDWEASEETPES